MKFLITLMLIIVCETLCLDETEMSTNSFCREWPKSHFNVKKFYYNEIKLAYVHFETFEQLNIRCGILLPEKIGLLGMRPANKHLLLDSIFDIHPLLSSFIFYDEDNIIVIMTDLHGFNMRSYLYVENRTNTQESIKKTINTNHIMDSHFAFYLNETQFITSCAKSF